MSIIKSAKGRIFGEAGGKLWTKYQLARLFSLFTPLDKHKYLCSSMNGSNYGCNTKAFADYIKTKDPKAKIVWVFIPIIQSKHPEVKSCILGSFAYFYQLCTSKFIIGNTRTDARMFPRKAKGQIYLQTWHGTAMKRIEGDACSLHPDYVKGAKRDSEKIDILLSNCRFMTDVYKNAFWYNGKVYEIGTPRNDIFFSSHLDVLNQVRDFLHLTENDQFILYAPTFRSDFSLTAYNIELQRFLSAVKLKFGGNWHFVIRLHPNLLTRYSKEYMFRVFPNAIDATLYGDMQELLYAADILLTDYSASMFDFMYSRKPIFLYVNDFESYDRGFYWKFSDLPFSTFYSNDEIEKTIESFSDADYQKRLEDFFIRIGNVEDGHACEKVYKLLQQYES